MDLWLRWYFTKRNKPLNWSDTFFPPLFVVWLIFVIDVDFIFEYRKAWQKTLQWEMITETWPRAFSTTCFVIFLNEHWQTFHQKFFNQLLYWLKNSFDLYKKKKQYAFLLRKINEVPLDMAKFGICNMRKINEKFLFCFVFRKIMWVQYTRIPTK